MKDISSSAAAEAVESQSQVFSQNVHSVSILRVISRSLLTNKSVLVTELYIWGYYLHKERRTLKYCRSYQLRLFLAII